MVDVSPSFGVSEKEQVCPDDLLLLGSQWRHTGGSERSRHECTAIDRRLGNGEQDRDMRILSSWTHIGLSRSDLYPVVCLFPLARALSFSSLISVLFLANTAISLVLALVLQREDIFSLSQDDYIEK